MTEPIAIIRPGPTFYDDLIEALRKRKDELGLSNEFLDEWSGRAQGYWTHVLGPSRHKALSMSAFSDLAAMFGFRLELVLDMDAVRKMEAHWEKREGNYRSKAYRFVPARLSTTILDRAKPMILGALSKSGASKGGKARAAKLSKQRRSQIARKAARARWRAKSARGTPSTETCDRQSAQS